jgi:hypothetical protein
MKRPLQPAVRGEIVAGRFCAYASPLALTAEIARIAAVVAR